MAWLYRSSALQRIGLLFSAGVGTGLSFAPFYLLPLLAISYPLLLLVVFKSKRYLEAFSYGWWFGFGQFFFGLIWIAEAFEVDDRYSGVVGYLAVGSLAAGLAIFSAIVTGGLWQLFKHKDTERYCLSRAFAFVALWGLSEWVRGHIFTGFPWNLVGYAWGFSDVMLQTVALWGIYGLGLFTLFLAAVPYVLIQNIRQGKSIRAVMVGSLFVLAAMGIYGTVQLSVPTEFRDDVTLRVVQANISQQDKWNPVKKAENFLKYLRMSKSPPQVGVTHVIW
ncbi:MAG: hypothetical protein JKY45_01710, partial [Emcibacter sp.]|nr:hypothetical protein [Emcibacter sp.]